jgi:hypothetical protein
VVKNLGNNASDIIIHHSYGQIFGPEELKNMGGKTNKLPVNGDARNLLQHKVVLGSNINVS